MKEQSREARHFNSFYTIAGNIERISDHALNVAEYAQTIICKEYQAF